MSVPKRVTFFYDDILPVSEYNSSKIEPAIQRCFLPAFPKASPFRHSTRWCLDRANLRPHRTEQALVHAFLKRQPYIVRP